MTKYYTGIDLAIEPKWWQRIIVWFGFRNKWWDYSCRVTWKKDEDGKYIVVDMKQY